MRTARRSGEQQVGDVCAGDEQHQTNRAQQDKQRFANYAKIEFSQRLHVNTAARVFRVRARESLLALPRQCRQLGTGLTD